MNNRTSDDERSALENLPDVLFNRIVQHFHDPQDFFSLAATKYSFKSVMHQTRAILAFGLLNMTHADREANGKKFYRRAAAQGSIEGMIVHSDFLFADAQSDGSDFAAVEHFLRSVLAREADDHDENDFIALYNSANAFSGARLKLAQLIRERYAEGEPCPEAESLLRSVIELGPMEGVESCAFYLDSVIELSQMIAEGQSGPSPSPRGALEILAAVRGALEILEAVAEPDGLCHFMMGRMHASIMEETGEAAPAALTHFLRALELEDSEGEAASALCDLYQQGCGIPEAQREDRLFFSNVCLVVAAFKYKEPHAVYGVEQLETAAAEGEADGVHVDDPGFDGFLTLYSIVQRWVFSTMGLWILDGREAPAVTCTISGTMTLHEVLTSPVDDLSLPDEVDWSV